MFKWIGLAFILYLSNYVDTYRLYSFGQTNGPVTRPVLNHHPLANCLYNNWSECKFVPRDTVLKMLTNTHGRVDNQQSEMILNRLLKIGQVNDRRAYTGHEASPGLVYPQFSKQNTPIFFSPQRRTFNGNQFINPPYPWTNKVASPLSIDGLFTQFLPNRVINNKIPLTNTNILHTTLSPEITLTSLKSVETISESLEVNPANSTQLYKNSFLVGKADANEQSSFAKGTEGTPPETTVPLEKPAATTPQPLRTTPLIYNITVGVTNYVTINAFTEEPKNSNDTVNTFSTTRFSEITVDNNHTLPTDFQYRKTYTESANNTIPHPEEIETQRRKNLLDLYSVALDKLERKFYTITFNKLTSTSTAERRENGISFVQSGLFLSLQLMAFSTETDEGTRFEIDQCLELNITNMDKIDIIKQLISELPKSNFDLKWRWSSRLVLGAGQNVTEEFRNGAASALKLLLGKFHGNETNEMQAQTLNQMIEKDSGGAIRNTFEPEELSEGVRAVALSTLYLRARWRSAPTVLNGSRPFRDADGAPPRTVRMIRINDYVRYANFEDWNFQAIEIFYATRGLSLLMLVPHGRSLRQLAGHMETVSIAEISRRMIPMRVAVTMPLYTLRMTLLLPSKLKALGVNQLISDRNATDSGQLKLSHAIQRLMFWAEAGRNAFKDDGIEWDAEPEMEIVVDRPYLFFVRWHNITLMTGNFVL